MTDVTMPRLSDSMEEGTILRWLKHDGESVEAGEDLVEIETDKATVTHAAEEAGVVEIVVAEGTSVPVGQLIARVGEGAVEKEGEVPPAGDVPAPPPPSNGAEPAQEDVVATGSKPMATPLARRLARTHGIRLEGLSGSGPRGRITRADVLSAAGVVESAPAARESAPAARESAPAARESAPAARESAPQASDDFETQEPTRVQQLIARRMSESRATIPDFEVETEVVMDQALEMRASLKDASDPAEDTIPSINDFVVKACAIVLRRHPRVNGSYADGRFKLHRRVNIGIAVATEEALVVPTLFDADAKSLGAIAREARRLAARVRSGEIGPPELSSGTFTVSNLGMFGMTAIRPVINPPQAAILGVGAIRETLARRDGEIVDRRLMTLTLSADHRILYGADAARFLADVRALLESPLKLAL